jgi:hypothetical protein
VAGMIEQRLLATHHRAVFSGYEVSLHSRSASD